MKYRHMWATFIVLSVTCLKNLVFLFHRTAWCLNKWVEFSFLGDLFQFLLVLLFNTNETNSCAWQLKWGNLTTFTIWNVFFYIFRKNICCNMKANITERDKNKECCVCFSFFFFLLLVFLPLKLKYNQLTTQSKNHVVKSTLSHIMDSAR